MQAGLGVKFPIKFASKIDKHKAQYFVRSIDEIGSNATPVAMKKYPQVTPASVEIQEIFALTRSHFINNINVSLPHKTFLIGKLTTNDRQPNLFELTVSYRLAQL